MFYEQNRGLIMAPGLKFEEQRIKRDVDLASDLYINLDRQLEVARIDEINDAALITVIDSAIVPRKAKWPRYGVMGITAILLGGLAGILLAGSAAVMADWKERNPGSYQDVRAAMKTFRHELATAGLRRTKRASTPSPATPVPPEEAIARVQRPVA